MTDRETSTSGIGQKLKETREARDLTQQDVCDSLNLLVRVVDDMETENWTRLPPAAFTRGYLRAYAKLLGIDADAIVERFDAIAAPAAEPHPVFRGEPAPRLSIDALVQKQPGAVLSTAVALVVCCVLVVLWAVWPDGGDSSAAPVVPTGAAGAAVMSDAAPTPSAPTASAPTRSSGAAADAAPAPPAAAAVASDTAGDVAPAEPGQVSEAEAATEPSGDTLARRITPDGDDRLDFVFAEDSWVEVKDRAGKRVFADLGRAGQSLELVGKAPFAIVLGNAPGVDLSFNGERVVLSPHTRNNIATLALGQ